MFEQIMLSNFQKRSSKLINETNHNYDLSDIFKFACLYHINYYKIEKIIMYKYLIIFMIKIISFNIRNLEKTDLARQFPQKFGESECNLAVPELSMFFQY